LTSGEAPLHGQAERAHGRRRANAGTVARAAIFTAFVAATTMAFSVYIPATRGYFDVGEIMVYVTAMLMGPYVGAFAGGVGSAVSDGILAPVYAPGTLVIKGVEGLVVGYLSSIRVGGTSRRRWILVSVATGLLFAALVGYLGVTYLSGQKQLYLGLSYCSANCSSPTTLYDIPIGPQFTASFDIPQAFWVAVAAAAFVSVVVSGVRFDEKSGWPLLCVILGGSEMVLGYFLYESFALQLGVATASVEVPVNVGQVLVGALVAVPLVRSYRRIAGGRAPGRGGIAAGGA
jgi:uncharacterized membrane protein